jgi:hypothetical protein
MTERRLNRIARKVLKSKEPVYVETHTLGKLSEPQKQQVLERMVALLRRS